MRTPERSGGVLVSGGQGELLQPSGCLGRIDDQQMIGELEQLTYGLELVVAYGDLHPVIIDRFCVPEPGTEDAAREIETVGVEQRGDHDNSSPLQPFHQLMADRRKINIGP